MSDIFDMAEQVQPISYEQATLMYNLGFSIEVSVSSGRSNTSTIMDENCVDTGSLENKLLEMGVLDEHLEFVKPVTFYAEDRLMKRCGLHIEHRDGSPSSIEYGTCEETCQKLIALNRQHPDIEKYVSNKIAYVTI